MSQAQVGRNYDRWVRHAPMGRFYAWLASVPGSLLFNTPVYNLHTELQVRPEHRVLDIGCGRGSVLRLLTSKVPFQEPPVGLDLSSEMLRLGTDDDHGLQLLQGSGTHLPLADASFDVVVCAYVTQHLDNDGLLALLQEIRRALKPGGLALLWDFAPTRSAPLNAFHQRILDMGIGMSVMRTYTTLSAYALEAGFDWVANAHLRPFLFPPIPRVSMLLGKAPEGWQAGVHQKGLPTRLTGTG